MQRKHTTACYLSFSCIILSEKLINRSAWTFHTVEFTVECRVWK